ncbi:MAG: trypsin-like peptidase domain-containing protein [Clostridia bacterium]|nr:trypsin-like peptidase domain-containing protein [Clostridia bacterium]
MSDWMQNENGVEEEKMPLNTPEVSQEPPVEEEKPAAESSPEAPQQSVQPPVPPVQPPFRAPSRPPVAPPPTYWQPPRYAVPQPPAGPHDEESKTKNNKLAAKQSTKERVLIAVLASVCAVAVVFAVIFGIKAFGGGNNGNGVKNESVSDNGQPQGEAPTLQITDLQEIDDGGLPAREIVQKNLDATVVLTLYHKNSTISSYDDFYGYFGDYFGGYYGDSYGSYNDYGSNDGLTKVSEASGIVMSEDGYIITNSHCVFDEDYLEEFGRIDVKMYDGTVYEDARIIGYDRSTDLAVIKIDATGLTPAEFGDSSALSLGDRVMTLGNSGGLSWSASQGILSGQARDVYEDTGYAIKCLQVDAVINPGSSGGPLLNAYGQVVGVNSAKIVLTGYEGLGFSIPINEAKTIIDDLIRHGYATGRVSLGIKGQTVTSIGYEGFIIEEIDPGSALEGTKAKEGDIITHVNGVRVMNYEEMRTELTKNKVGDTITLTLIRLDRQTRKTTEFDVKAKLGEMK